jgi:hypothetical protein
LFLTVLVLSWPESKNSDGTLACGCWLDVAVVVVGRFCWVVCLAGLCITIFVVMVMTQFKTDISKKTKLWQHI